MESHPSIILFIAVYSKSGVRSWWPTKIVRVAFRTEKCNKETDTQLEEFVWPSDLFVPSDKQWSPHKFKTIFLYNS